MRIRVISRREKGTTGTTRYTTNLCKSIELLAIPYTLSFSNPNQRNILDKSNLWGFDVHAFFSSYPLFVDKNPPADVYHLSTQTLATALNFQRFSAPVAVTVHDIIPWIVRKTPQYNTLRNPIDRWFYWLALKGLQHADLIICVSEFTRQSLNKHVNLKLEKMVVIHEPVDHTLFQSRPVPRQFMERFSITPGKHILYVGSYDPRKNLSTLLRGFAMLHNQRRDVQLWLVGNPHFTYIYYQLRMLASDLGISECVRFFGQVTDEDLVHFYNSADVVIMPSLYEGFGLPVIEAMSCRKPVIITRQGALPEIAGEAGIILEDPLDHNLVSEKIQSILEDEILYQTICESGYYHSIGFSYQNQAMSLLKAYQSITRKM